MSIKLFWCALCGCILGMVESGGLFAINPGFDAIELYKKIGNNDAPTPGSDRAYESASVRRSICDEITHSGYFAGKEQIPVDVTKPNELSTRLRGEEEIFSRMYTTVDKTARSSPRLFPTWTGRKKVSYKYENPFTPRTFAIDIGRGESMEVSEAVFLCLLENKNEDYVYRYYVTKEYNVVGDPFRAGRFLIQEFKIGRGLFTHMYLAEEAADVYTQDGDPAFNVELIYLKRRLGRTPEQNNDLDPVCRLLSRGHLNRLCAVVLTSPHYRANAIHYPQTLSRPECAKITISFESAEARRTADAKQYWERAATCECGVRGNHPNDRRKIFISWAYAAGEVFVYERDLESRGVYVRNLTVGVGLVRGE